MWQIHQKDVILRSEKKIRFINIQKNNERE